MATIPLQAINLPPVPSAMDIVGSGKIVSQPWQQWFVNVENKVNAINDVIVAISGSGSTSGAFNTLSPLTTKGDLIVYNGTSNVRLPVGANGYTIIADSTQPDGMKWAPASGGGAPINIVNNTSSSYIVQATDLPNSSSNVGWITSTYATANYIQVDTHANQTIPIGAHLYVSEEGAGQTTIQALPGVTFVGATTATAKGVGEAVQIATDIWHVFGNLAYVNPSSIRGLIGYWKLDETSGTTAVDSSGFGHNGTYVGTVTLGNTSILPSATGHSTKFSSTGYVSLPTGFLNTVGRPFTIFGWGNTPNVSSAQQIMASALGGFSFYLSTTHMYGALAGVSNNISDTRTMVINTTYFWALTVDASGNAYIYVNGSPSSVASSAFSSSNKFVDTVTIGSYSGNFSGNYFQGSMQNVGICNVALTGAEITNIYTTS